MKKYIVHFIIWGLGIISYYILDKTTAGDEFQNISLLLKFFWTKNIWSRQFLLIFIAVVLPVDLIDKAAQQDDGPDEMQPEHQNNKRGQ